MYVSEDLLKTLARRSDSIKNISRFQTKTGPENQQARLRHIQMENDAKPTMMIWSAYLLNKNSTLWITQHSHYITLMEK